MNPQIKKIADGLYSTTIRTHKVGIMKSFVNNGWTLTINGEKQKHVFKTKKEAVNHAVYLLD